MTITKLPGSIFILRLLLDKCDMNRISVKFLRHFCFFTLLMKINQQNTLLPKYACQALVRSLRSTYHVKGDKNMINFY